MKRILLPLCATFFMTSCDEGQEFDLDAGLESKELASWCVRYVDVEKEENGDGLFLKTAFNSIEEAVIQTAEESEESCEVRVQKSDYVDENELEKLSSLRQNIRINYGDFQGESTHKHSALNPISNTNSRASNNPDIATFQIGPIDELVVLDSPDLGGEGELHEQFLIPSVQTQCTHSSCQIYQYTGGLASGSFITQNADIGYGTSGSGYVLNVKGRSDFFSGNNNNQLRMGRDSNQHFQFYVNDANGYIDYEQDSDGNAAHHLYIRNQAKGTGENDIRFYTSGSRRLTIADNGNVTAHGIFLATELGDWDHPIAIGYMEDLVFTGSAHGNSLYVGKTDSNIIVSEDISSTKIEADDIKVADKLAAKNIEAEKIVVSFEWASNWPDYVFRSDYKLMSLEDVETYISENGHLPSVPSAEEVVSNGISIADSQARLLEKIEELTLHLIEQNKKNIKLEQQLANLSEKVAQLRNTATSANQESTD